MKLFRTLTVAVLLGMASTASAATIVSFEGNSTVGLATGTATIDFAGGNTFTGTITNTSPDDARLTGFGFDLGAGNLSGFSGSSNNANFQFTDADAGNVPQFDSVVLDFAYLTGSNFSGGSPNLGLDQNQSLSFTVTGSLAGFTEAQIASAIYARFQRVGLDGQGSDVATVGGNGVNPTVIPEPGTMLLLGTGLLAAARARRRRQAATE